MVVSLNFMLESTKEEEAAPHAGDLGKQLLSRRTRLRPLLHGLRPSPPLAPLAPPLPPVAGLPGG